MSSIQQNFVGFDFQEFIQRRFKLGRAHYLTLLTLGLVQANDGIQSISISLLTPIIKEQLYLNENQVSFLTSVFYIGVGIGALISGIQSNQLGRKKALIFGTLMQLISSILLALNISYLWLCGCRFIYGVGFGSTLAVSTVIITQLMPINLRGRTLLVINFINSVGKLCGVGLAFLFIKGKEKYVSQYMLSSAVINLVAVCLVLLFVKESFRFYLFKTDYQKAYIIMNQIIKENDKSAETLSNIEKQSIKSWSLKVFNSEQAKISSIKLLSSCKRVAILLSIGWFFINFVFFGEMFIVPFMLNAKQSGLGQYFWMTLGQIPSLLLTFTLIQKKGCGRKTSLTAFFIISSAFCLLTLWSLNSTTLFLTKLFMKAIFQMLYPFTSQSYATSVRSIGFAVNSFFGRLGATLMPFIIYPLYNRFPNFPFLILSILSFSGAITIYFIKNDTFQKPLDEIKEDIQEKDDNKNAFKQLYEEKEQQVELSTTPSTILNQRN